MGTPFSTQPLMKETKYHTQINKRNNYGTAYVANGGGYKHTSPHKLYGTDKFICEAYKRHDLSLSIFKRIE